MRLPRLKLSVRGLMLLIVGVALGIWLDRSYNRYNLCMVRAAHYKAEADKSRKNATDIEDQIDKYETDGRAVRDLNRLEQYVANSRSAADLADSLRSQALRAAFLPFVPVPYDESFDKPMVIEFEPPPVIPVTKSMAGR